MLLACRTLKPEKFSFALVKGYRPTKVIFALRGDWSPGPYPETPEERRRAAKRYGLIEPDYEPFPDDGFGAGDYPKLNLVAGEVRDPFYSWNDDLNRDFKEPVDVTWTLTADRYDPNYKPFGGWWRNLLISWGLFLGYGLLCYATDGWRLLWPVTYRAMPYDYHITHEHYVETWERPSRVRRIREYSFPRTPQDMTFHYKFWNF